MKRNFLSTFAIDFIKIETHMFNEILDCIQKNGGEVLSTQVHVPYASDNGFYSEISTSLKDYEKITKHTNWCECK